MARKLVTYAFIAAALAPLALGLAPTEVRAQLGDIELSAFVDVYYMYNFNEVDPLGRVFDTQHNTFALSYAEITLAKPVSTQSRVGGRIDFGFGATPDLVASFEPGGGDETYKNIQQAYVSYLATENLTLDLGKFVTPLGAEVIESQGNWNYSRSFLFGFAIPLYHAGLRASLAVNDQLTLNGFLVNGWNNTSETNGDKTVIAGLGYAPNEQVSWFANVIAGNEDDFDNDGEEDLLWVFDTTVSYVASETLTLMANFDYGSAADMIATDEAATWWGIAAYARLQARDDWAVAGRFEYVDDSEGGFMTLGEKAQSFTATSDHTVFEDLIARFEFRFDTTETDQFVTEDGTFTQNQPSLTAGFVYVLD